MKLTAYAYTNRGGRENNEDSLRLSLEGERGVFVVADGLGGHQSGEVASALAADAILDACAGRAPEEEALTEALRAANARVLEGQGEPGREDMRTTAVALWLEGERALWAHVGDSRLLHFSGGALAHATRDHSVTYRKFLGGEISYMDIYHDDDRSSLLRVLGRETCQPEAGDCAAAPGDAFLLCTDGLWEFVYREEMLADWLKAETPEQWARLMLLRRVRRAGPGSDNFSLITVFVEE